MQTSSEMKLAKDGQQSRTQVAKAAKKTGGGINPIGQTEEMDEEADRAACLSRPRIKIASRFDSEAKT